MGFGIELKKLLKNKGISVAELSRLTDIPVNTLYAIINRDSNNISVNTVFKIYRALNLSSDEQAILDMCVNPDKWGISHQTNDTNYYLNDDARDMAQFIFENPEYKVLFDASRKVKKEDIQFVKEMLDRMRKED